MRQASCHETLVQERTCGEIVDELGTSHDKTVFEISLFFSTPLCLEHKLVDEISKVFRDKVSGQYPNKSENPLKILCKLSQVRMPPASMEVVVHQPIPFPQVSQQSVTEVTCSF